MMQDHARRCCYDRAGDERLAMADSSVLDLRKPRARLTADLPARLRERVLATLPGQVERIVLFGSRATGETHGESDWDFAVFLAREPTEQDQQRISEIGDEIGRRFDSEVQVLIFAGPKWLARDELACNIRDHGLIIYGSDDAPMIERPVLEHARAALSKAERFAEQAAQALPQAYETVVHNSYYAMFHAARAALLALERSASTSHGRVVETFGQAVKRRKLGRSATRCAAALAAAYKLRAKADYGNQDLTEDGRRLREGVAPFLALARSLLDQPPG
jgi:uncharacterized protein (UPF0332 family)/predicted nucleotidyltransferase